MVYVFDAPITGSTFSLFFFFAEGDNDDDGQISKCKVKTKAFPCITMINLILPYHIIPSIFHRIKRTHRIALDGRTNNERNPNPFEEGEDDDAPQKGDQGD